MGTGANDRVSPGRVVAIFAVLLAVWLGSQFLPRRQEPPPPLAPVQAESRLRSVGLADNPDWDGLPELFAVWADKVAWDDQKVCFAYWHPGARTYAYFFEATRRDGSYRFNEVSLRQLLEQGYQAENGDDPAQVARRESETSTHPFVFLNRPGLSIRKSEPRIEAPRPSDPAKPTIELKPAPLVLPPPAKTEPR